MSWGINQAAQKHDWIVKIKQHFPNFNKGYLIYLPLIEKPGPKSLNKLIAGVKKNELKEKYCGGSLYKFHSQTLATLYATIDI